MSQTISHLPKGRIEYIDALRGFTMILVVFQHVATFCWHLGRGIPFHDYFIQVRMPMFFFISGFVMYKAHVVWDWQQIKSFFKKKIPVQLISPFIFFCVFLYVSGSPFIESNFDATRMGYWFTFVLFIYYVFYAIIRFFIKNKWSDLILILFGFAIFSLVYRPLYKAIPIPGSFKLFFCIPNWYYFIFFVLGTLAKKHFNRLEKVLDNTYLLAVCIMVFFLTNAFIDVIPVDVRIIRHLLSFPGLVVLFSFFRIHRHSFRKETVVGRTLQYIGKRTLDIYLIHFFLLPKQLEFITVFSDHPMPIIEAAVSLSIAALIVAACLLIGNIIRLSPLLAHWVFGAKITKPETPQTHVNDSTNQ